MSRLQDKKRSDVEVRPSSKTAIILAIIIILNLLLSGYLLFKVISLQHSINILTISSEEDIQAIDRITTMMANISQMQVKVDSQMEILKGLYNFNEYVAEEVDKLASEISEIKEASESKDKGQGSEWKKMYNQMKDNMNNMYQKAKQFGSQRVKANIKEMKETMKEQKEKLKEKRNEFMKKTKKMWQEGQKRWASMFEDGQL